jgi:hypothetical protein
MSPWVLASIHIQRSELSLDCAKAILRGTAVRTIPICYDGSAYVHMYI